MNRACKTLALAALVCLLTQAAAVSRPATPPQLPPLQPAYVPPSQAPGVIQPPNVDPQPGRSSRCIHQAGSVPANQRAAYIHRCIYG